MNGEHFMIYVLLDKGGAVLGAADRFDKIRAHHTYVRCDDLPLEIARRYLAALKRVDSKRDFMMLTHKTQSRNVYQITIAPRIGEVVSSELDGVFTPRGKIVEICKSFQHITTSTGMVFVREEMSTMWMCGKEKLIR